ncbi:protein SSUH2 homolog [Ptychodera flava]|uniref:protein SSUH2 homolog n=1 Tax=Ptychodera flava TaxID=63121 RepID=UPI00396A971C
MAQHQDHGNKSPAATAFHANVTHVEVPHTASVKPCHDCVGLGRKRCNHCYGIGRKRCAPCNGSGRQMHQGGQCPFCLGLGRNRCSSCNGHGHVICRTCNGGCELKVFHKIDHRVDSAP